MAHVPRHEQIMRACCISRQPITSQYAAYSRRRGGPLPSFQPVRKAISIIFTNESGFSKSQYNVLRSSYYMPKDHDITRETDPVNAPARSRRPEGETVWHRSFYVVVQPYSQRISFDQSAPHAAHHTRALRETAFQFECSNLYSRAGWQSAHHTAPGL